MRSANQASPAELMRIGNAGKRFAASGFNPKVLRTLDLLQKDEWKALDDSVVKVARSVITGIADLRSHNLVRDLGTLGVLIDEYERVTEVSAAEQNMTGIAPGQKDLPGYDIIGVPIPVTFKDFQVNIRTLEASRQRGVAMDTVTAELSARQVSLTLDEMVFNGSVVQVGSGVVYGYTNHPDRITGTLTDAWTDAVNRDIMTDVLAMLSAAEAINYRGPFTLYVPTSYMSVLREDYSTLKGDRTFLERILAIPEITEVKGTPSLQGTDLSGDEVLLVQMTSDVVDLSIGQDIVTVEWDTSGGLVTDFKVMAAMAPRVKSSSSSQTGVVHYTKA
mgnify:CR=1 FL=1|tara:strand:- start:176 stop:1174 length:999 start_codon:yes stop_codon:yes gene_type:complete